MVNLDKNTELSSFTKAIVHNPFFWVVLIFLIVLFGFSELEHGEDVTIVDEVAIIVKAMESYSDKLSPVEKSFLMTKYNHCTFNLIRFKNYNGLNDISDKLERTKFIAGRCEREFVESAPTLSDAIDRNNLLNRINHAPFPVAKKELVPVAVKKILIEESAPLNKSEVFKLKALMVAKLEGALMQNQIKSKLMDSQIELKERQLVMENLNSRMKPVIDRKFEIIMNTKIEYSGKESSFIELLSTFHQMLGVKMIVSANTLEFISDFHGEEYEPSIRHKGDFRGMLDTIALKYTLNWHYDNNSIEFYPNR